MTEDEIDAATDRVMEFLSQCGDTDIEAGIGYLLSNSPEGKLTAFKASIAYAIRGQR